MKRFASCCVLLFMLFFVLGILPDIEVAKAEDTIYIRPDGRVEGTDKILREGGLYSQERNLYRFTADIYDPIVVERDDIVIDGAGYGIEGTGAEGSKGIHLKEVNNVTIKNVRVRNFEYGIHLYKSTNNTVSGSTLTENLGVGINLWSRSSNNTVCANYLSNNKYGLSSFSSDNNTVAENIFTNNEKAISIGFLCSNNVFRSNSMVDNGQSFLVGSNHVTHDVDSSNTVNGKPMYYWVNRRDLEVPSDAGYVFLVNCTGITVRNLNLDTGQKIILRSTTDSRIIQNVLRNSYIGLEIQSSDNNTVAENNITNNNMGIWLSGHRNNLVGNHIAHNGEGVYLNAYPWHLVTTKNLFYRNSFINNTQQTSWMKGYAIPNPRNRWDNGAEGNYWSNYEERYPNATEMDNTGIWDTPYIIDEDNQDRYPLTSPTQPDTTPPTITITNPQNETIPANHTSLNFTVNKFTTWMGYTLDGATNITVTGNTTLTGLSEGSHRLTLYAEDATGNIGASEPEYFTVDTTPPTITILSPMNETYQTAEIKLNFTSSESLAWSGYSINGEENVTLTGNLTLSDLSEGSHWLTVYANDTVGNMGASETIYFNVTQKTYPVSWLITVLVAAVIVGVVWWGYRRKRDRPLA